MKKTFKKFVGIACVAVLAMGVMGAAACSGEKDDNGGNTATDVAGTYTISFTTSELSGNVRHTGYLTAMQATETNTVVLKSDMTYEYTKYVTSNRGEASAAMAKTMSASVSRSAALLTWQSAGDGNCTLVCYADGTYEFAFKSMGAKETGTWSWNNWTFTLTTAGNKTYTATMDGTTHALNIHYVADMSAQLTHDFTVASDVWGAAFGGTGSYTPVEGGEEDEIVVSHYYTGTAQKSTEYNGQTVTYDVTEHVFLLNNGVSYVVEATETNSNVTLGEWEETEGVISITLNGSTSSVSENKVTVNDVDVTLSENIPADYADADWAALIEEAQTPVASGPIVIEYVFKGTYTVDGTKVTLNAATSCEWSEDWGRMQAQGFTNCSGDENDVVYPKGEGNEYYMPLDHFAGQYYFAPGSPAGNAVTNNIAVKIEVNKTNNSFVYSNDSVFDE